MNTILDSTPAPIFEIDQPEVYGPYILHNAREICLYLGTLLKQGTLLTAYLDDGEQFFLSTLLTVDEAKHLIFLDLPNRPSDLTQAQKARQITLSATVDRVKIQARLGSVEVTTLGERKALAAILPERMLRLQRREFFRVNTPRLQPLRCRFARRHADGQAEAFELPLYDISGGGLCLVGNEGLASQFSLGELFADCRLDIPGESVLSVNLRVREIARLETHNGEHQLRLGCEFVNLPGTRLALIERYITRLERERKAKQNGLI